jgi:protein tyrosine phosphatase
LLKKCEHFLALHLFPEVKQEQFCLCLGYILHNLLINHSFQKINRVLEDRKSFSVGGGEENRNKNRSELVIPYDRNRVILTPIPGREHSTYINASFIEVSL